MSDGGVFLWLILAVGGIALFIILLRAGCMRMGQLLPARLVGALERLGPEAEALDRLRVLAGEFRARSALGRVTWAAFEGMAEELPDLEGAVEARARREVTAMQWGLSVLEVVVTIAPLLGLLGTAAGLVDVFGGIAGEQKDVGLIALGVGKALSTTIAGLAVAVPAVIAHGIFSSTVERAAGDMEVLMHRLVGRLVQARRVP